MMALDCPEDKENGGSQANQVKRKKVTNMFLNSSAGIFSFVCRQESLGREGQLDLRDYLDFASYAIIQTPITYSILAVMKKGPKIKIFLRI